MAAADDDDIEVVEGRAHGHASVGANAANLAGAAFRRKLARFLLYPYQHSAWHAKSDNRTEQGPVLRTPGTLEGRMSGDVRPSLFLRRETPCRRSKEVPAPAGQTEQGGSGWSRQGAGEARVPVLRRRVTHPVNFTT